MKWHPDLKKLRLQSVLTVSYALIILPIVFIVFVFVNFFISSYQKDLVRFNAQFSNEFKLNMEYDIKEIMSAAQVLYSDNNCRSILRKPTERTQLEILRDKNTIKHATLNVIYHDAVSGVYMYTNDGQYYFTNCNTGTYDVSQNLLNSEWLQSIKPHTGKFEFLSLHEPQQLQNGTQVISLAKKLIDIDYNDVGLLLVDIRPEIFKSIASTVDKSFPVYGVIDDTNTPIYASDNSVITLLGTSEYANSTGSSQGDFSFRDNGTTFLASYCTSTLTGWKIISILPMRTAVDRAILARNILVIIILFSLGIATLFSIRFSKKISQPILKLNQEMKAVAVGDFNVQCNPEGTQETVQLADGFNAMVSHIRNLLRNEYQLKMLRQQAEFRALQNQINPHFLYNTLETIAALADINHVPQVSDTCLRLSDMFRYSISSDQDVTLLRNELRHLDDYIQIIKLRFGDQIRFKVDMDPELNNCEVLKLVLQPLAENAVKHGLANCTGQGLISFKIITKENDLIIRVSDNGAGVSQETLAELRNMFQHSAELGTDVWLKSENNIGLCNIHMRLMYYYGADYGITDIQSTQGSGFSLQVTLPAQKHFRRHREC